MPYYQALILFNRQQIYIVLISSVYVFLYCTYTGREGSSCFSTSTVSWIVEQHYKLQCQKGNKIAREHFFGRNYT